MILNVLNALYDRLSDDPNYGVAKQGYSPQNISFRVILKNDGALFAIQDARVADSKGKLRADKQLVLGDAKSPGAGINPGLLWDNAAYMLGYKKDDPKPERTRQSFDAFRSAHLALEEEITHPQFAIVCRFLEQWAPEKAREYAEAHPEFDELAAGFGVFQVQGENEPVNAQPEVLAWWDSRKPGGELALGQCLITGAEAVPIARLHPKIKSVVGAQSAGASLVSFNAPAYESYRKDQSFNAPVSEKAAFQYGTALNSLLNGPKSSKHRIRIGDTTCVFWTDKPTIIEDVFGMFAAEGSNAPEQVQDEETRSKLEVLLKVIQSGGSDESGLGTDADETNFHILGLAPNAARLSVRFFHRSTVGELLNNLCSHHRDIGIVREWETPKDKRMADPEFPAYWMLLSQTARVADDIPPLLGGALMRSILEGTHYPEGLYSAVIRRIRADRSINYLRAAILKGVLTRNHKQTISTMLDTESTDPAYLLGRLFAALEKTQQDTLGELNAGLRDKFYSSASATPASVFPRILRTYQHHLSKLSGGSKVNRERLVQTILDGVPATGFPRNLNLKDQGIFALGYYHQRKEFFTKKSDD